MKFQKTEYRLPVPPGSVDRKGGLHRYEAAADSFKGLVRRRNEDSFAFVWDESEKNLLAAVADGIGSTWNGDIAGNYAVRLLVQAWRRICFLDSARTDDMQKFLSDHFCEINRRFFEINQLSVEEGNSGRDSLGTTLTAAIFTEKAVIAANAGDSPLFRIRDGRIQQITFNHNLANELLRNGQISHKDAGSLLYGQRLTRFIGPKNRVDPECYVADVRSGDYFLMCTDGLTLHIDPEEICHIVIDSGDTLAEAVKILFRRTIQRGAMDNVTAILVRAV